MCNAGTCHDWANATANEPSVIQWHASASYAPNFLTFGKTDVNNNPMPYLTIIVEAYNEKVMLIAIYPDKLPSITLVDDTLC